MIDLKTMLVDNCEKVEGPMSDLFHKRSDSDHRNPK